MATLTCYPNGAGNSTQFTAVGDSANYLCVDDLSSSPDSDTTYVEHSTTGTKLDLYTFDFSGVPSNAIISNIAIYGRFKRVGGTYTSNKLAIRIASTNYLSGNKGTATSYTLYGNIWVTNPNSGAAWTVANLSTLECGVESVMSVAGSQRITSCYAVVTYTLSAAQNKIFLIG